MLCSLLSSASRRLSFSFVSSAPASAKTVYLSAAVPVKNSCLAAFFYLSIARSGLSPFVAGSRQCASYVKQLLGCWRVPVAVILICLWSVFSASFHCVAFAASFSPRTLILHESLSCAVSTRSSQLVLGSMSISMSPCFLHA